MSAQLRKCLFRHDIELNSSWICQILYPWVNVFKNISEFRILRLTFHRMSWLIGAKDFFLISPVLKHLIRVQDNLTKTASINL